MDFFVGNTSSKTYIVTISYDSSSNNPSASLIFRCSLTLKDNLANCHIPTLIIVFVKPFLLLVSGQRLHNSPILFLNGNFTLFSTPLPLHLLRILLQVFYLDCNSRHCSGFMDLVVLQSCKQRAAYTIGRGLIRLGCKMKMVSN